MKRMRINPAIFRAYDIRGRYPKEVNLDVAVLVGRGFALFVKEKMSVSRPTILLGRDLRFSSDALRKGFIEGAIQSGADCIDLGVTTTPEAIYIIATHQRAHAGAMITASHNPAEYNGFKFYLRGGEEIGLLNGLKRIRALAEKYKQEKFLPMGQIKRGEADGARYVRRLHQLVPALPPLRVLIDAAGGAAGTILPKVLSRYRLFYRPLFFDPDPHFSRHHPNPLDEDVATMMKRELQKGSFDLGVSFDGDGDRAEFFDENGAPIRSDIIFALLAAAELKKKQKKNFVFELTHARFLGPFIEAYGGQLFVSKVGGVSVRRTMREKKAILGGELSGHIYHGDIANVDSAIYTMLRLITLLGRAGESLSRLVGNFRRSAFRQFSVKHKAPQDALKRILAHYKAHVVSRLDGVTVQYPSWWFNIRMSNTEPLLRLTIETDTDSELKEAEREIKKIIG